MNQELVIACFITVHASKTTMIILYFDNGQSFFCLIALGSINTTSGCSTGKPTQVVDDVASILLKKSRSQHFLILR